MVTVHKAMGFRFVIFMNDHSPPHIHILGHGGEAKVTLDGPNGLELDWMIGINRGDMRALMIEVQRQRSVLLEAWKAIHG